MKRQATVKVKSESKKRRVTKAESPQLGEALEPVEQPEVLRPCAISCLGCGDTLLGLILPDLHAQIESYWVAKDSPRFKKEYKLKDRFSSQGDGPGYLSSPFSVAVDDNGNLYVVDFKHRIQVFSSKGEFLKVLVLDGVGTNEDGRLDHPYDLKFNNEGDLVVVDRRRIQVFTTEGELKLAFGACGRNDGEFNYIRGVAVSKTGEILITDSGNHRVQRFSPTGDWLSKFGSAGKASGCLTTPTGIAVDRNTNNILVVDQGNYRLQCFDSLGMWIRTIPIAWQSKPRDGGWKPKTPKPWGIVVDKLGNYAITEQANQELQVYSKEGVLFSYVKVDGMNFPMSLTVSREGDLILTDLSAHQIIVFG